MKIIVFIEGGIVQTVMTDKDAEVMVVDYDTEGVDLGELMKISGEDAYVYRGEVHEVNAILTPEIWATAKSDTVRKVAEDAGIPVVEIETDELSPEDLKGLPVLCSSCKKLFPMIPENKDVGIWPRKEGDAKLFLDELREDACSRFCPKCHQSWATHNDDGSCIVD